MSARASVGWVEGGAIVVGGGGYKMIDSQKQGERERPAA